MQEAKTAYRKLVLKYHPDKSVSKQDCEKFKLIIEAYHILKTGQKNHIDVNQRSYGKTFSGRGFSSILHSLNPRKIFKEKWHICARGTERVYHLIHKHTVTSLRYPAKASMRASSALVHLVITRYSHIPSIVDSQVYSPLLKKCQGIETHLKSKARLFQRAFHPIAMRALYPHYLIDLRRPARQDRSVTVHEIEISRQACKLSIVNDGVYGNIPIAFEYNPIKRCMKYKIPILQYTQVNDKFGKFSGSERKTAYFAAMPQVMKRYNNKPHGAMNLDGMNAPNAHYCGKVETGDTLVDPTVRWRNRHSSCLA